MAKYAITKASTALSTTTDLITIIAPASRRVKIYEILLGGLATASAANVLQVARSTGGATGASGITPVAIQSDSVAAASVVWSAWTTQPTLANVLLRMPVNSNGGVLRWVALPGNELELRNSEQLSLRSEVGTGNISITVFFEEF